MSVTISGSAPTAAQAMQLRQALDLAPGMAGYTSRPIIGFAGDSISLAVGNLTQRSSLFWALAKSYSAECRVPAAYNYAVGGTTSTQILATLPSVQAGPPDILILNGGTNDSLSTKADVNTVISNMQAMIAGCLAAGVKALLMLPYMPKSNVALAATTCAWIAEINWALRNYCEATAGAAYVDLTAAILDPTSTAYSPIGTNTGTAGSMMSDGLHPGTLGGRAMAPYLAPYLQALCRPRKPRAVNQTDVWDATNNIRGNVLGSAGLMQGTNGTLNAVANAGVAASWAVTTANGITATPSLVTSSYLPGGYKMQKFDLSGTTSGAGTCLTMVFTRFNASLATNLPKYDAEVVIRNNAANLLGIDLTLGASGGSSVNSAVGGVDVTNLACMDLPTSDETLFLCLRDALQTVTGNNQLQLTIHLAARTGVVLSGSVEIGFAGVFAELP